MPRQKYEREIVEILERMDRPGGGPGSARAARPPRRPSRLAALLRTPTPWTARTWLALSLGLPLLATLMHVAAPIVGTLLVLAGIFLFLSPLVLALFGVLRQDRRPLWRGRVIELPERGGGARWRFRLWAWRQRWERWRRR
ncbi:MAG: hypothetical protein IT340_14365 [Chloroflexi bacterium]|nr:hypothetical protein [Chloroflexota bacterium]